MRRAFGNRRLARVFSAQALNQAVTIVVQLALVPILLKIWGVERYGSWLVLSAIPAYLVFSDFGFTLIAKNEMTMAVAAGERDRALIVYKSVLALLNVAAPIVSALSLLLIWIVPLGSTLSLGTLPVSSAKIVLVILIANVILYQYFLLLCAGVRCEGRAATESMWVAIARLFEGVALAVTALAGGGLVSAALSMFLPRLAFTFAMFLWLKVASPWLNTRLAPIDWSMTRRFVHPALAFMIMPISQALLLQGPVLLLGHFASPALVVVYSTTRTLTRAGTSASNLINASLVTEYSLLYGSGKMDKLRRLLKRHFGAIIGLTVLYTITLNFVSKPLMNVFTHGKVSVVNPFFFLMTLAVMAEMIWTSFSIPLSSINRHVSLSHWLIGLSTIGLLAAATLPSSFGMNGISVCIVVVHAFMVAVVSYSLWNSFIQRATTKTSPGGV